MRELPILFSTPMVQAMLEDRKKMTRRTQGLEKVNECPDEWTFMNELAKREGIFKFYPKEGPIDSLTECNPRYQIGDHLWVRETHYAYGYWEKTGQLTKTGKPEYKFHDTTGNRSYKYMYEINSEIPTKVLGTRTSDIINNKSLWFKRPSLYMPKIASRIWLECIGIRCERLHDISEEDAKAEGILNFNNKPHMWVDYCPQNHYSKEDLEDGYAFEKIASNSFLTLWESINGIDSVRLNPWVFIYEFKRIEKEQFIFTPIDNNINIEWVDETK